MLTYSFDHRGNTPMYLYLYQRIKEDILAGNLPKNTRLPSKRNFAKNLGISTITVENAYAQLQSEGYIYSQPKRGFYVMELSRPEKAFPSAEAPLLEDALVMARSLPEQSYEIDLVSNKTHPDNFPFSIWAKIIRETLSQKREELMTTPPCGGILELRSAIASHLKAFRGMEVAPEQIIVGAGTEYLYGLIIQLLGHEKIYAIENPGYQKLIKVYHSNRVICHPILSDDQGMTPASLEAVCANVAHISPSHHFPTGKVTAISRRYELLAWSTKASDRYIIEDDYDSEFRMTGKPIPTMQSIDMSDRVIYVNTFTKTLSSTIRLGYMVLPMHLLQRFYRHMQFYSCTVSNFEQYTLAHFLSRGYFEKHINRMRTHYKTIRDELLSALKKSPLSPHIRIYEEDAGLHFLLGIDTGLTDAEMTAAAKSHGLHLSFLSQYYFDTEEDIPEHMLVLNYSAIARENIPKTLELLSEIIS